MPNTHEATCPVCKRQDSVHCVYVPLGHGRYCQYLCLSCKVQFPWGDNKFGDITSTDQIKKVRSLWFSDNYDSKEEVEVEKHPDFTPWLTCWECQKDITHKTRHMEGGRWLCFPKCHIK